jgi:COP9 signalosome complex subunit 4
MYLDRILRQEEIKEFQATLKPHQLAQIAQSSSDRLASLSHEDDPEMDVTTRTRAGPETVLDRAVMEHNLLSCSKIYVNITFAGLGALLDLRPGAAETMARKMIEQGRLRGSIDQVARLLWFDGLSEDDEGQGKAGGLGEVELVVEDTGAPSTKHWDRQIRSTATSVRMDDYGALGLL